MKAIIISTCYTETPPKHYGGIEQIAYLLAKELSDREIETWLVASSDSPTPEELGCNYNLVKTIPTGNSEESMYVAFKDHILDKNLIEIDSETVIIDHTHSKWMYLYKQEHPEINLMSVVHDAMPFASPPPVTYPCMIAVSKSLASNLSNVLGIHVEHAYNGVDHTLYEKCLPEEKENYMLFMSRIVKEKGPHEAIYISNSTKFPLIISGNDSSMFCDQVYVHSIISKCDGDRIKYIGEVSHEKKVELMKKAKITLLPISFKEPFGLVAIESMMCGTPVIALDNGAYSETVLEGGFVCKDIDEMTEISRRIMIANTDDSLIDKARENGLLFSSKKMADRYEELMKKCIEQPW